jgi:hypothetical protein
MFHLVDVLRVTVMTHSAQTLDLRSSFNPAPFNIALIPQRRFVTFVESCHYAEELYVPISRTYYRNLKIGILHVMPFSLLNNCI